MKISSNFPALLRLALLGFLAVFFIALLSAFTLPPAFAYENEPTAEMQQLMEEMDIENITEQGDGLEWMVLAAGALMGMLDKGALFLTAFALPGAALLLGIILAAAAKLFQRGDSAAWKAYAGMTLSGIWLAGVALVCAAMIYIEAFIISKMGMSWHWTLWLQLALLVFVFIRGLWLLFRRIPHEESFFE